MTSIQPIVTPNGNIGADVSHQFNHGSISVQGTVPTHRHGHSTVDVGGSYHHDSGVSVHGKHGSHGSHGGVSYQNGNHNVGVQGGTDGHGNNYGHIGYNFTW